MHQVQFKVFRRTLCWVCSFYIWYRVGCGPYHWEGRWHSTREYIFVKWCCHDIISCRVAIPPSQRQKESFLPEVLPAACDKKMLGLKMVEVEDIKSGSFHFKVSDGFCFVLPWRAIESLFALTFWVFCSTCFYFCVYCPFKSVKFSWSQAISHTPLTSHLAAALKRGCLWTGPGCSRTASEHAK